MSTETVSLNFDGNFAAKADESAKAATKLATGLGDVDKASKGGKASLPWADDIKKASSQLDAFEKKRAALKAQLSGMSGDIRKATTPPAGADGSWIAGTSSSIEGKVDAAGSRFTEMGASAGGALGAAAAGLAIVVGLAAAAASAVYGLGKAFATMGVIETSKAEVQREIMSKIGGDYDVAIKLAGQYGLDADKALEYSKKLLKAQFSQAEVDVDMRVIVGLGAVEGEEKAKGYVEKLAAQAAKGGKATEDTIKGFAEVGIKTDRVWQELAKKLGVTVAKAKTMVKTNAVEMKDALDSVRKAAEVDFGGVADSIANSVPALLARVKLGVSQLFSGFDLTPMKDALRNASELLEGPEGKILKQSFSEAGSEIIKALFGPFQGDEGKRRLISVMAEVVAMMRMVRDMAKAAAPAVKLLLDLIAAPAPKGSSLKDIVGGQKKSGQLGEGGRRVELPSGIFSRMGPAANDSVSRSLDFSPLFDETSGKSAIIGDASVEGMANAIRSNPDAISAMAEMAGAVLMQARQTLQVQSPSKAMAEIGDYTAQGFAVGAEGSDAPARAGKAIAEGAMGGAAGGAAGGAGAAGPAGGGAEGPVTINVIVPPGSSAETQAAAKRGSEEGLREWQAYKRRDAREAA